MGSDPISATERYFDAETPEYAPDRVDAALEALAGLVPEAPRVLEVGCGTGTLLARMRDRLRASRAVGLDPSARSVEAARARGLEAVRGSVLDEGVAAAVGGGPFDVVVLAAVLHHLVGATRRASRAQAARALAHARDLAAPGGWIVVVEPVFEPPLAMDAVFWAKRAVTAFTSRRVAPFGRWNNLGAPVVSYFSPAELEALARAVRGATVTLVRCDPRRPTRLMRLAGIRARGEATLLMRRDA